MKHNDPEVMLLIADLREGANNLNKEELLWMVNFLLDQVVKKTAQLEEVCEHIERICDEFVTP